METTKKGKLGILIHVDINDLPALEEAARDAGHNSRKPYLEYLLKREAKFYRAKHSK